MLRDKPEEERESTFSLPVIVPIVLYNGERPWNAGRRFRDLFTGGDAFGADLVDFEYILLDVERYTEEELLALSNTIGAVFLLDQTADQNQLLERLRKLMDTIRNMPGELQGQFMNWLVHMIAGQLPADSQKTEQLIQEMKEKGASVMGLQKNLEAIRKKGYEQGIEQGIEQGREAEKRQVAMRLIGLGLGNEVVAMATGFSEMQVGEMRQKPH